MVFISCTLRDARGIHFISSAECGVCALYFYFNNGMWSLRVITFSSISCVLSLFHGLCVPVDDTLISSALCDTCGYFHINTFVRRLLVTSSFHLLRGAHGQLYLDGLMLDCCNSNALAMGLLQSCAKQCCAMALDDISISSAMRGAYRWHLYFTMWWLWIPLFHLLCVIFVDDIFI